MELYTEEFEINYGHIKNKKIKDIPTKDLKRLEVALNHNKLLKKTISEVLKKRKTININDEINKLLNPTSETAKQEEEIDKEYSPEKEKISKPISKKYELKTTIPIDYSLSQKQFDYAIQTSIKKEYISILFDNFKNYYIKKQFQSRDWNSLWNTWVDKNPNYTPILKKETVNLDFNDEIKNIASDYMNIDITKEEFIRFYNYYKAKGTIYADWKPIWENWCINHKQNNQKNSNDEQKNYRWEFRKAQDTSDKIKKWLEFDLKINWMDKYYWKDIPNFIIKTNQGDLKIGWKETIHPDFNKKEILLYRINESKKIEDPQILDAEIL